jgi:hypothetical protein
MQMSAKAVTANASDMLKALTTLTRREADLFISTSAIKTILIETDMRLGSQCLGCIALVASCAEPRRALHSTPICFNVAEGIGSPNTQVANDNIAAVTTNGFNEMGEPCLICIKSLRSNYSGHRRYRVATTRSRG